MYTFIKNTISKKRFSRASFYFFRFLFKNIWQLLFIFILFFFLMIFLSPSLSFALGNIFFGNIKPLYNIRLAQLLYIQSTHPLFPVLPPRAAHYQLSRTYFIQGKLSDALNEAKIELEKYPDNTKAYYIIGLTYGYMNRNYDAIDAFSHYIETNPDTWAGRNDKAWIQFRIGDIDGAFETMQPVVNKFKSTPWVQNTYCVLLINKEQFDEAKKVCSSAREMIDKMNKQDWGHAYPGNDPEVYSIGLEAMKSSIRNNEALAEEKSQKDTKHDFSKE